MDGRTCSFETARLRVRPWGAVPRAAKRALVTEVLTAAATTELPPHWQGPIADPDRWLDARDEEAPAMVAHQGRLIGFLTLHADGTELRIGYVLGEAHWGRGLASELVAGVIGWARETGATRLLAGVTATNAASARVLEKNGFQRVGGTHVLDYRLDLST